MKFILVFVILVNVAYSATFSSRVFKQTVRHVSPSKFTKLYRRVSPQFSNIAKNINLKKLAPIDKVVEVAKTISKKSPFANKMMASKDPLYAITLYNKGGDKFFKQSDKLLKNTVTVNSALFKKLTTKFPNFRFVKSDNLTNTFVDIMKKTGKFGIDVTKKLGEMAIRHPKSAITGILYGWFLADPQSFQNALNDFGGNIGEFAKHIGTLIGAVVVGGTTGVVSGVAEKSIEILTEFATFRNLFFLFLILIVFLVWKFRSYLKTMFISSTNSSSIIKKQKRKGRF